MANEHDGQGRKFIGMYVGSVVSNADPLRLGRVRVRVPGVAEPASAWALPLGGGSGERRGGLSIPEEGAEVAVWFQSGDVDHPYYLTANWHEGKLPGRVGGYFSADEGEADESSMPIADVPKVPAWEGARYLITVDEREGKTSLLVRDKKSDDQILFDGEKYVVQIKASSMLNLRSDGLVLIEGAQVIINGRPVAAGGTERPIK